MTIYGDSNIVIVNITLPEDVDKENIAKLVKAQLEDTNKFIEITDLEQNHIIMQKDRIARIDI